MTGRVQLALNVDDLDESIAFYRKLFGAEPAKVRPGYANFAVADPPLKLILLENRGQGGSLNHLGVEVASTERWEIYTVLEDSPTFWGQDGSRSWEAAEAALDSGQAAPAETAQCCGTGQPEETAHSRDATCC